MGENKIYPIKKFNVNDFFQERLKTGCSYKNMRIVGQQANNECILILILCISANVAGTWQLDALGAGGFHKAPAAGYPVMYELSCVPFLCGYSLHSQLRREAICTWTIHALPSSHKTGSCVSCS